MIEDVFAGIFAAGIGFLFIGGALLGLIEILGKIFATYKIISRGDLSGEQRIIYLVITWFIPLGWLIYLLLGTKRTRRAFSELDFL